VSFALRRCVSCASAATIGAAPAGLHDSGAYQSRPPHLARVADPILRAFDRQRLARLESLAKPPARLLDAGAGRGRFLATACAAGYDAFGIEPSARGSGATAAIGAVVRRASIERAEIPAASLDAVTIWHVLEHLEDPGGALDRIARWLRPGGALLVGVPNLASLQARIGAERWYHLDVPRHRVHFTPAGLHELLRRHGFTVVRTHHILAEHNPFGMWQSLLNRVTRNPSYLYNLLKHNAPLRSPDLALTVLALPLAPLAAILELLAGALRSGGTIAVLAQRNADGPGRLP
jgi:SAM-dependent methyltransferase